MTNQDVSQGVYVTGHFTGDPWQIVPMTDNGDFIYAYTTNLYPGDSGAYYYLTTNSWDNYEAFRETVPAECAIWWGSDRGYTIPDHDTTYTVAWGSCAASPTVTGLDDQIDAEMVHVYPNPGKHSITLDFTPSADRYSLAIMDAHGRVIRQWKQIKKPNERMVFIDVSALPTGSYTLSLYNELKAISKRILIEH